jgi:hypothetical protein
LRDDRAQDALAVAIERDAAAKSRARTDPDFADVKGRPWFELLTR